MNNSNQQTFDLLYNYLPLATSTTTSVGYLNSAAVVSRQKTPFFSLADELCKIMRTHEDDILLLLAEGFITMYNHGKLPVLTDRLSDAENVKLFDLYYVQRTQKEIILDKLGIDDERTLYKRLKRSRELFSIALYDFCMFVNQ